MNESTPLPPDIVDELLSAALDGELDAAAADLGVDPALAQAVVAGHGERYARLAAARDAIAEVPALDEVTRRRLVSATLAARSPSAHGSGGRRRIRRLIVASGAAAALVLLAGIGALTVRSLSSSSERGDDSAAERVRYSAEDRAGGGSGLVDLGDISEPGRLRVAVTEQLAGGTAALAADDGTTRFDSAGGDAEAASRQSNEAGSASTTAPTARGPVALDGDESDAEKGASIGSGACVEEVGAALDQPGPPLLAATAVYEGRAAGVSVYRTGERLLATVYALDDCTLLASQSWDL